MKGILLAAGTGSRLYPATMAVNKHFIPIYNKPMIYYSLSLLLLTGIKDILIIVNKEDLEKYKSLFGSGNNLGVNIKYKIQENPLGLAHGIILAEDFIENDNIMLVLGDNILFSSHLGQELKSIKNEIENNNIGCYIFGYKVKDPERFGVIEFDDNNNVISVEEKPQNPKSNFAAIGVYMFNNSVIDKAKKVKPSKRGELEITDIINQYIKENNIKVKTLGRGYAWFDAGTYNSFIEASNFIHMIENKTNSMIGCIEEIAYNEGFIDKEKIKEIGLKLKKTDYGKYLLSISQTGN